MNRSHALSNHRISTDRRDHVRRLAAVAPWACVLSLVAACVDGGADARLVVEPVSETLAYPHSTRLDLTWTPLVALPQSDRPTTVFVHLLDRDGNIALTFDHPFPHPWRAGRLVSYPLEIFQSGIDPPLPSGAYTLTMGLVDASGRRSRLAVDGSEISRNEYAVARFEVPDGEGATPRFSFAGSWEEPHATETRQTLANRWLGDSAGRMLIWGVDQAGEARLNVSIFDPGNSHGSPPRIGIRSGCGRVRGHLVGAGTHQVSLAIDPRVVGDTCTVTFDPDDSFRTASNAPSALLRSVSWAPVS